jgi:translocation and assembly module TamB
LRRLLRWSGLVLCLFAVGALGLWLWLQSKAGEAFVLQKATQALASALPGTVHSQSLDINGNTLTLRGVFIAAPGGEEDLRAESVEAVVDLVALVRGELLFRRLVLNAPTVIIQRDDNGVRLTRAFVREAPSTEAAGRTTVRIDEVVVHRGTVVYRDSQREVRAETIEGTGQLSYRNPPKMLELTSDLQGQLDGQPLRLVSRVVTSGHLSVSGDVSLGDSQLTGVLLDAETGALSAKKGVLSPAVMGAFVPGWPVVIPVAVEGSVSNEAIDVSAEAGGGRIHLVGRGDLQAEHFEAFELTADRLNPAVLTGGGEPSSITGSVGGQLTGFSLDTVGKVSVRGVWADLRDRRIAHIDGQLEATAPRIVNISQLKAELPGATVLARGRVTPLGQVEATATIDITDASATEQTIRRYSAIEAPPLAGHGRLQLVATGALTGPRVRLTGQLQEVTVGDTSAKSVTVALRMPNARRPLEVDGRVATTGTILGGSRFDRADLQVITIGRNVDAVLDTKGLGDARVHVMGELDRDANGIQLQQVDLSYDQTAWALEQPTSLRWARGHLVTPGAVLIALPPIDVSDGPMQRLDLRVDVAGRAVNGTAAVQNLYAKSLPSALVPSSWRLDGLVDGTARLSGSMPRPAVATQLTWRAGSAFGVSGVAGELSADVGLRESTQANGQLRLASPIGELTGAFQWPVATDGGGPIAATLRLDAIQLSTVASMLDAGWPVSGTASAVATLGGSRGAPTVALTVESSALQWAGTCVERTEAEAWPSSEPCGADGRRPTLKSKDLRLDITTADGGLSLEGTATIANTPVRISGETAVPESWLTRPPSIDLLKAHPWHLRTKVLGLEVSQVAPFVGQSLGGRVSLDMRAQGPWLRPEGSASFSFESLQVASLQAIDGTLHLTADSQSTRVLAETQNNKQPFVRLRAAVAGGLADVSNWSQRNVAVSMQLEPTAIDRLWAGTPVRGTTRAMLDITGTIEAPVGSLTIEGERLTSGSVELGQASAKADISAQGPLRVTAAVRRNGVNTDASLEGTIDLPHSLARLRNDTQRDASAVKLELSSQNLDLAFLTGAHPMLRRVAGLLTARAQIRGTLGDPTIDGSLSWSNGRLGLLGYGDYRDISLDAVANSRHLTISKLEAKSGAGTLKATGSAERQAAGTWAVAVEGTADRFPTVVDDQLLATATLQDFEVRGTRAPGLITLTKVEVAGATIRLPEVKRKDLQGLDRPGDVVVLREGRRSSTSSAPAGGTEVVATLDIPSNLWVKSADVNVELGLSEGFRVEYNQGVSLTGVVAVKRGTVTVASRRFEVNKESTVAFTRALTQPLIDAQATYSNEREKVKVTAVVTGRGKNLSFRLTSDPPMPENEVFALLATGRRNLKRGSGTSITSQAAVSVLGGLVLGPVRELLLNNLPVDVVPDVLSVDLGQDDAVRIEVGKYLGDRVYVGTRAQPGANPARGENTFEAQLEVLLLKNMGLEVTAGTAPAGAADVVWSIDF